MRFPRPIRARQQGRRQLLRNSLRLDQGSKLRLLLADYLDPRLICCRRRAMACDFEFRVPDSCRSLVGSVQRALDLVDQLEEQMSVFRESSEITRINRQAHARPIEIESRLFGLLQTAVRLSRETGQAFDVTSGTYTNCWGFLRRKGRQPATSEIESLRDLVGSHLLKLDSRARTVQLGRQGVALNLGGIGKGYALDRAAAQLREVGIRQAHLHAGFSSVYAMGNHPGGSVKGWPVGIRDPIRPEKDFAVLYLADSGLGTSGVKDQGYVIDGKVYGHIIDPRSGYPSGGKLLALAVAPSAAEADALSTAFFVMELEEIRSFCEGHPGVGALVLESNRRSSFDHYCFGPIRRWLEFGHSLERELH